MTADNLHQLGGAMITFCALLISSHLSLIIYIPSINDEGISTVLKKFKKKIKSFFFGSLILSLLILFVSFASFFIADNCIAFVVACIIIFLVILEAGILFLTINSVLNISFNKDEYKKKKF